MAVLDEKLTSLLKRTFPSLDTSVDDAAKISGAVFGGGEDSKVQYTEAEKAEINQWTITATHIGSSSEDAPKQASRLQTLNTHLSSRTTLLGSKPSVADVALFAHTAPLVSSWSREERTGEHGYHHIVRHADFVQHSPLFGPLRPAAGEAALRVDADDVAHAIRPVDAKAEKERKKREKEELARAGAASASAAGATATSAAPEAATPATEQKPGKMERAKDKAAEVGAAAASAASALGVSDAQREAQAKKKAEKEAKRKAKEPSKPAAEKKPSPALIDLRVGHILKAVQHPNADSLYVSTIAVGDAAGAENTSEHEGRVCRTVCSGLSGKVPLEEMQGRKVVVVCNLKPVTMRGIKSCAMVLAASPRPAEGEDSHHASVIELVTPPAESNAGEKVYVDGWQADEPEGVLNPKKKIWESVQPGYQTSDQSEVEWDIAKTPLAGEGENKKTGVAKLKTKDGACTVKSLKGASIS